MEQFDGLVMFYLALGAIGVYSLIASLIYFDSGEEQKGRIFQGIFFVVLFAFMGCGLYFYSVPIPS